MGETRVFRAVSKDLEDHVRHVGDGGAVPALPELLAVHPQPPVFAVVYACASHAPKTSLCATKFWHSLGACVLLLLKIRKSNLHSVATQRTPQRQEVCQRAVTESVDDGAARFFPRDARLKWLLRGALLWCEIGSRPVTQQMLSGHAPNCLSVGTLRELGADPSRDCSGVGDGGRNWLMELSVKRPALPGSV